MFSWVSFDIFQSSSHPRGFDHCQSIVKSELSTLQLSYAVGRSLQIVCKQLSVVAHERIDYGAYLNIGIIRERGAKLRRLGRLRRLLQPSLRL